MLWVDYILSNKKNYYVAVRTIIMEIEQHGVFLQREI
jgi:hypothetical protein